jgi:hypothetical protein
VGLNSGETVYVLRPGTPTTDRNGDPIAGPDVEVEIEGCGVAPRPSGDTSDPGRLGVIIGYTVYIPDRVGLVANTDRLRIRSKQYVIEGEPGEWIDPHTGRVAGTEIAVRRVEG